MKSLLILTLYLLYIPLQAQVYFDYNQVKENYIKDRNSFKREAWFYQNRMGAEGYIKDVFAKSIQERNAMRNSRGFFLESQNLWTNIGPTPGAYQLNGAASSRIPTIKYHPANPNIIYLGSVSGGIWKTTDAGVTWVPKTDNEISMASGSICIDPANPEIIYCGTGEVTYSGNSYTGRGLLKSTNGGDTWTNYTTGLPPNVYCSKIEIRPGHSNEILYAASNGLYRSSDAGITWTRLMTNKCEDIVFSPTGDTCYIMGSVNGTGYRISTNGGLFFSNPLTPFPLGTKNRIAICKSNPSILYAASFLNSIVSVYKSIDAGSTFTQIGANFDFNGFVASYCFYVHVSPFDPDLVLVGTLEVQRSTNGGSNWQYVNYNSVHIDQNSMDFHPVNPNEFIVGSDGGVWKTTNRGNNWTNLNNSLTLTQFYRIASDYTNVNHVMGGTQDNGTQRTTGSLAWSSSYPADGGVVCFHPKDRNLILGETQNNGVIRSTNGGQIFSTGNAGLTGAAAWIGPIVAHPDSAGVFYTARASIFKTKGTGDVWSAISIPSAGGGVLDLLAISKSNPAVMYCGGGTSVYKSTNRGYNWTDVSSNLPTAYGQSIEVHPDSPNVVVMSTNGAQAKLFKTTNGGESWMNITGNIPASNANDIIFYYPGFATNTLIAALDAGVFITNNNGVTWTELAAGLPNTIAIDLDYNVLGNRLRIGTYGRGVWEMNGTISGVTGVINNFPEKFSLSQNYPNPFNPVTKINYTLNKEGIVSLKVYNLLGREIKELVSKLQLQGTYEAVFDGSNLNSGVYFYVLKSGEYQESRKMMLTK